MHGWLATAVGGVLLFGCVQRDGLMVNPALARADAGGSAKGGAAGRGAGGEVGQAGEAESGEPGAGGAAGSAPPGTAGAGGTGLGGGDGGHAGAPGGSGGAPADDAGADSDLAEKDSCPVDDTLLLCLRFEKQLVDESTPSARLSGEPLVYEAGPTGMAVRAGAETLVHADGGLGYLGKAFTAEAWVRVDRFPQAGQRAGVIDKELHFGLFVLPGGDVACSAYGATATAKAAAPEGDWISLACRAEGNTLTVYVNGVSRDEATFLLPLSLGPERLSVGSNQPAGDPLYGLIDNVRLWNSARTPNEICASALDCAKP